MSVLTDVTYWLIQFEEEGKTAEIFTDETAARTRYEQLQLNWACHLFVQADHLRQEHADAVQAGLATYPRPCGLCPGQIESSDDLGWHGLGNCVPICEHCLGSGIEPKAREIRGAKEGSMSDKERCDHIISSDYAGYYGCAKEKGHEGPHEIVNAKGEMYTVNSGIFPPREPMIRGAK